MYRVNCFHSLKNPFQMYKQIYTKKEYSFLICLDVIDIPYLHHLYCAIGNTNESFMSARSWNVPRPDVDRSRGISCIKYQE